MIRAYSEFYLSDAKNHWAEMLDYAVNDCRINPDWFSQLFIQTGFADHFEKGNPGVVAGKSGIEIVSEILRQTNSMDNIVSPTFSDERSPEYWAGWALAEYQWYTARRYKDIFVRLPLSQIIGMYPVYHQMDIRQFIDTVEKIFSTAPMETKLKQIRESRELSQTELAALSGVKLRSIQMYEQRVNNIDKAQVQTLYKLSRVLGCTVEDLLEQPMAD